MVLAYLQMRDMGDRQMAADDSRLGAYSGIADLGPLSLVRSRDGDRHHATAREILDRRLADGAISVEEYERLNDAMHTKPAHP